MVKTVRVLLAKAPAVLTGIHSILLLTATFSESDKMTPAVQESIPSHRS